MKDKCDTTMALLDTPFSELPLGSVRPEGWLRDQLEIMAEGLTGHLDEFWPDVGPDSGWLGGSGDSWERGPYYLDGLLPLAYLLEDERLKAKVRPWIEWTLSSQQPSGQFGPASNEDWWSRMIMLKVLTQHAEYTGDDRVIPFMTSYFRYQLSALPARPLESWAKARGGENVLSVYWLYERTREPFLLELARLLHAQTIDWSGHYRHFPFLYRQTAFDHRAHVVNVAMSFKEPALRYLLSKDEEHLAAASLGIERVMSYHGQVNGMFSGDEWLAGTHPSQGTELCAVVEYMFTLEHLARITGDGKYGDFLERAAYNALPAAVSPDWKGHQYDQQANQIMCTHAKRNWTENGNDANLFGIEPHFGCCTANMHQGWPKLAARLWMDTADGGFAAVAYAPCRVVSTVGESQVTLVVDTQYPFREVVFIKVKTDRPSEFPLYLRIPAWCEEAGLEVNGRPHALQAERGYARIARVWHDEDALTLRLPMKVVCEPRANGTVGVLRGPLVFAVPIKERWQKHRTYEPYHDWEVYPESPWNYGIRTDGITAREGEIVRQPFSAEQPPVRLSVQARRIPSWTMEMNSAGTPPAGPVASEEPLEKIDLIPYGCARLRISEIPVLKN